jgi:FeS assembly SUF system protein
MTQRASTSPSNTDDLRSRVIEALRAVRDPELPVNIYDLGLVYSLDVNAAGDIAIVMTLTTPNCPVAELIPTQVKAAVIGVPGVREARVELTWTPAWTGDRMSDDARIALDMMGIAWSDPHASMKDRVTPLTVRHTIRPAERPPST